MNQAAAPQGTTRAATLTGYADLARTFGLDPYRELSAVGLPRAALDDSDLWLSSAAVTALLERSSRVAEDFGLRLAESRRAWIQGPMALIAREQPTVRAVIEAMIRYLGLHTETIRLRLEDAGDVAILHYELRYRSLGPSRQSWELGVAQLAKILRLYLGAGWRPIEVSFIHGPPKSMATHHRVFGRNVLFDQPFAGLVFSQADLARANESADPELARLVERFIDGLGGPEAKPPERVRDLVRTLLPAGRCTAEVAARQLGMSLRTLQRQLAAGETSFKAIVEDVRQDLASQFVDRSARPLVEVANLLGFAEHSAFARWHRTQFGVAPSERRSRALGAA